MNFPCDLLSANVSIRIPSLYISVLGNDRNLSLAQDELVLQITVILLFYFYIPLKVCIFTNTTESSKQKIASLSRYIFRIFLHIIHNHTSYAYFAYINFA